MLELMNSGGVIFFAANSRCFQLDEEALAGFAVREISKQTVPEDFRNEQIHRCQRIVATQEMSECDGAI